MDSLPIELWAHVFLKLRRRRDWLALSSACRVFHRLAEAEIYRRIYLSRLPDIGYSLSENRMTTLFARSITERPDLAHLIRSFALGHPTPELDGPCEPFSHNPVLCQISSFSNLSILRLSNCHIDADLCSTLHRLPRLNTLDFAECDVDPALSEWKRSLTSDNAVLDLSISLPRSAGGWTAVARAGLRSLLIEYKAKNPEDNIMETIISEFMESGQARTLTKLDFINEIPSNILSCLASSPRLVDISLSGVVSAHHPINSLPAETIPSLERFSGPAANFVNFIRGRPVHTARLYISSEPMDILRPLQLSSVPVTKLVVRGDDLRAEHFQHAPTTLQHLQWNVEVSKEAIMSWIPAMSRMPDLQVIKGIVHDMAHLDQRDIIYAISQACPSVRDILFVVGYGNDDRWSRSKNGNWEHYTIWD